MIKRVYSISIILFACLMQSFAQETVFAEDDKSFFEKIIKKQTTAKYDNTGEAVNAIAMEFIGEKYVAGTLENRNEELCISHSKLDCTTFVETVLSIYQTIKNNTTTFESCCHNLEKIRYRGGIRNGYTSRLHYISWWIDDNTALIEEITTMQHTAQQTLNLSYMSTHPDKYPALKKNPKATELIADLEKPYRNYKTRYIPKENVSLLKKEELRNGDIIAIVTSIEGLDISHIGFATWHGDSLHMIHASSSAGKVIDDTTSLHEYLKNKKSHLGIRVLRVK